MNRDCRYGHGPLHRQPGLYTLSGAEFFTPPATGLLDPQKQIVNNGRAFAVVIYRCMQCGSVELFDEEKAGLG